METRPSHYDEDPFNDERTQPLTEEVKTPVKEPKKPVEKHFPGEQLPK